jgi:hypothetical protein
LKQFEDSYGVQFGNLALVDLVQFLFVPLAWTAGVAHLKTLDVHRYLGSLKLYRTVIDVDFLIGGRITLV